MRRGWYHKTIASAPWLVYTEFWTVKAQRLKNKQKQINVCVQSPILWTKIEIEIQLGASVRDRDRASKLDLDL
jgi:hypothetical protein